MPVSFLDCTYTDFFRSDNTDIQLQFFKTIYSLYKERSSI